MFGAIGVTGTSMRAVFSMLALDSLRVFSTSDLLQSPPSCDRTIVISWSLTDRVAFFGAT